MIDWNEFRTFCDSVDETPEIADVEVFLDVCGRTPEGRAQLDALAASMLADDLDDGLEDLT